MPSDLVDDSDNYRACPLLNGSPQRAEGCIRLGSPLKQQRYDSIAAKAVERLRVVVVRGAVVLEDWPVFGEPPDFPGDLGFEAASADSTGALAAAGDHHARARLSVG
jgi:hypothetical protein